jgi:hypothetical protein
MSFTSSAGWRAVIVQFFPNRISGEYNRSDLGEVEVVQILSPGQPDPTPEELFAIRETYRRYGGYATSRVVDRFWFGYPMLTPEQVRAVSGLP